MNFGEMKALAVDPRDGSIYVAERAVIRKISPGREYPFLIYLFIIRVVRLEM